MTTSYLRKPSRLFGNSVLSRRREHLPAIGERHFTSGRVGRSIFRKKAVDFHGVADLKNVPFNSPSSQCRRGAGRKTPHGASAADFVLAFYVEPNMRVHPLDLLDHTGDLHGLIAIELCRK